MTIKAGTPLQCPYCAQRVQLTHDLRAQHVIRCKCGGLASASLWAKHAAEVTAVRRRMN